MLSVESLRVLDDVAAALAAGQPVVALESTLITHGLPQPRNLETAIGLEDAVRAGGAVAATIAVLDGAARIGLTREEIERLAARDGFDKLSTRELPVALARGGNGATTVAATAFLAHRAGIPVFATGGIGGVHRGLPLDVSADLTELGRTPMVVVCAGAKSILDLAATREMLEALGVLVLGWQTDRFPGFYVEYTDLGVDARVESAAEVAAIWRSRVGLAIPGAVLLCAPCPAESALAADVVERAIADALADAGREGVSGKAVTPYLLGRLVDGTGGAALEANVALLLNNARVAAAVAREIAGT